MQIRGNGIERRTRGVDELTILIEEDVSAAERRGRRRLGPSEPSVDVTVYAHSVAAVTAAPEGLFTVTGGLNARPLMPTAGAGGAG